MANISKEMVARNAAAEAITGLVDLGSTYSTGHLSIYASDSTRITWHSLSPTAFGSALDGTCAAYPINDATSWYDATASSFRFENRDGSAIWGGLCSLNTGTGALKLESLTIPMDSTVAITTAKYIVPV